MRVLNLKTWGTWDKIIFIFYMEKLCQKEFYCSVREKTTLKFKINMSEWGCEHRQTKWSEQWEAYSYHPLSEKTVIIKYGILEGDFLPKRKRLEYMYFLKITFGERETQKIFLSCDKEQKQEISAQFPCMHYESVITNRHKCYFFPCRAFFPSGEGMAIHFSLCYFLFPAHTSILPLAPNNWLKKHKYLQNFSQEILSTASLRKLCLIELCPRPCVRAQHQ